MKKRNVHVALSLLMVAPWFYGAAAVGQPNSYETPKATSGGTGVTSYGTVKPQASNDQGTEKKLNEPWPWTGQEKTQAAPSAGLQTETPSTGSLKEETPALQTEKAAVAVPKSEPSAPPKPKVSNQPIKLFGRIEQLSGSAGASFPVLKAIAPKLDTRDPRLKAAATSGSTRFTGEIVKSFPTNNQGTWGGVLRLMVEQLSPAYFAYDGEEARRTQQALHPGNDGNVNFNFRDLVGGKIALEPASILFMVPMKDTVQADQISKMMGSGGAGNPFGSMMGQMAQSMQVPLTLNFGDINTSGGMETSVTGGQMQSNVIKNDIRELAQGVYEQDIVTHQTSWDKSGKQHSGYGETVLRFTMRNPQQMFVQAASVNYGPQKQFFMKMILEGWVTKGVTTNTNPMNAMGGMGELQNLFGGQQGKSGSTPTIPGLDPNMFKNMFGQ